MSIKSNILHDTITSSMDRMRIDNYSKTNHFRNEPASCAMILAI